MVLRSWNTSLAFASGMGKGSNLMALPVLVYIPLCCALSKGTLRTYWFFNAKSKGALVAWYKVVKSVEWDTPNEVIEMFPRASAPGTNYRDT